MAKENPLSLLSRKYFSYLYFSLQGRIGRDEFIGGLILMLVSFFGLFSLWLIYIQHIFGLIIGIILFFLLVYMVIALAIKRLHDINLSAWWAVMVFIIPNLIIICMMSYVTFHLLLEALVKTVETKVVSGIWAIFFFFGYLLQDLIEKQDSILFDISFALIIAQVYLLVILITMPGHKGENKYGKKAALQK